MKEAMDKIWRIFLTAAAFLIPFGSYAQHTQMSTYCNPLNIDYTYMIYNAHNDLSYRSGADPAVVKFRNEYYMFVTRSMGYWHSTDMLKWNFIRPQNWYFSGSNAPAAFNYKDSVLYMAGDPSGSMSIIYTDNPKAGKWEAVPAILHNLQDPALFIDDNGQAYVFWGSSNVYPIRAKTLDRNRRFRPSEETHELFNLDMEKHGWERFGHNHSDTVLGGYIEGPWLTRHNGKYYMQYAAPGTEFNVYGDGVYMADNPLGPYSYAPNNPVIYKPGGFANGAGHGSLVEGPQSSYWHFGTAALALNVGWERRIVMYPVFFDDDDLMYSNTSFGDYPHYAPALPRIAGQFTGWMLLSYKKPVRASSQSGEHGPDNAVDENIKTYWLAKSNGENEWLEIDLQKPGLVHAIQVNYQDHESDMYGRIPGLYHRYVVEGSADGKNWEVLADRSNNYLDVPNDYVELGIPKSVRYIRYRNIHVPTPHLAVSGLRIFGTGEGKAPGMVSNLKAERRQDRRDVLISWDKMDNAQGYNVYWGIAPEKLYSSWLVYDENQLEMKNLTIDQEYWITVEAFNENGVSEKAKMIKAQ
jgi:hypothetical protein